MDANRADVVEVAGTVPVLAVGGIARAHGDKPILRYGDDGPLEGATGDIEAGCLYAGMGAAPIDKVEPAGAMMKRLSAETVELMS